MMTAVALLLIASNPIEMTVTETVDVIEINHFYDEHGRLVFDQALFYRWCRRQERHNILAWRLVKERPQIPAMNWSRGAYSALWLDGEVLRRTDARTVRETWTQYDPELVEREWLSKERRIGLWPARAVKGSMPR